MSKKRGGSQPTIKGQIVIEGIKKYNNLSKSALARVIYKKNKDLFEDVEAVRTTINYYTGAGGKKKKESASRGGSLIRLNTFGLPISDTEIKTPYQVPLKNSKALIISDIHLPYHDEEALKIALLYGKKEKVDTIIINGDLFDFHQISRFEKNPKARNLASEIEMGQSFLKFLRKMFPKALIIFYAGNHDLRFNKFLYAKAPELLDIPQIELPYILGLRALEIIYLDNSRGITFGNLNIRHGHEFFGSGGVHPARTYYLKAKDNILVSHVHRTSFFQANDIKRKIHGGWSIGCLSELSPDYNINSEYNHGFAVVQKDKTGKFSVDNKMIIDGKLL